MRRISFENFKSTICHHVKDMGWVDFLIDVIENDRITEYWNREWFPEALYLLAMTDYVCRIHDFPVCNRYNWMRKRKLVKVIYPSSLLMLSKVTNNETLLKEAFDNAIPEFKQFNIVENEVEKVA